MKRLFFGLELSGAAREALASLAPALRQAASGRWTAPENYHVTLAFLGMTPENCLPQLFSFADRAFGAPFEVTVTGLGTFKNGAILWAGVEKCAPLAALQKRLSLMLAENGYPAEPGDYTPHITLARGARIAAPLPSFEPVRFSVDHAALFESARVEGVLSYIPLYRSVPHG